MDNYLELLNTEQQKAVKHTKGPLMVIAGAGSGKTRVLTFRIIHLIKQGVSPFNILSLTFTNKASKEMQNRIEEIVGDSLARNLWMGTFHSVFSRILRIESEKFGYPQNFTIYDTDDSKSLVKSIIKELNLDKEIYKVNIVRHRISSLKNNFITSKAYNKNTELIKQDTIAKRTDFGKIYQIYSNRCRKAFAMDFDDLLLKTYQLIKENPSVLLKYQEKFRYILIDEYQDTNHIQYLIIKKLSALNKNICIVGDDAQSIYSFRGANIQNILNFKIDYPNYTSYKLEQNYRSTSTIVNAANSIIKQNTQQIEKTVWTKNNSGEKIIVVKTQSDNDEGRLVSNTISDIQKRKQSKYDEFSILYRTNAQSRAIEESLRKSNIPYKIYGGLSFYQRKEIKDLLAYYRLTINPNDEEAFKRIINYPRRGIGATTIQTLIAFANNHNKSIWNIISDLNNIEINLSQNVKTRINDFVDMIKNFTNDAQHKDAYTIAEIIAKQTNLFDHLHNDKSPEGVSKFENIQELLNGIKHFSETTEKELNKLHNFMSDVALLTDQDQENKKDFNKVKLMTIHSAKGLEFPYVFIVGLEENLFPSIMSSGSLETLEEERRLLYVAITRAEQRLFISFASRRFKWGQFIDSEPSRFISELDDNYLHKIESELSEKDINTHKIYSKTKYLRQEKSPINQNYIPPKNYTKINNSKNIPTYNISKITNGLKVKHSRFGNGKVISVSGDGSNKKATVFFNGVGQKNLLLKFARLEIID